MTSIYQVDAFSGRLFHGNPASVVLMDEFAADAVMQAVAAENNQAETAFVVKSGGAGRYQLRWFTPELEMDLCGHATVAAAHVLWTEVGERAERIVFESRSGDLPVVRQGGKIWIDFPARPGVVEAMDEALVAALGARPAEMRRARDVLCVFESKREVLELRPDMGRLAAVRTECGVIVTAPGARHDFVSRFFAPRAGVPEDPVTGSAHCTLVPYWAERLGKCELTAHQVSRRGGELWCRLDASRGRVHMGGEAVTYMRGTIGVAAWR